MGKSNAIQKAEKADENFRNFLKSIQDDLVKKFEDGEAKFEAEINKFYVESNYDMLMVAEGHKWSYHLMSECGIATLKDKVKNMVTSFFGVTELPCEGDAAELDKTENGSMNVPLTKETMKALNIVKIFKNLASASAVNFLIGMFDVFSDKLEISAEHNYSAQTIAPGLTLHVDMYTAAYSNESFLNNDRIVESYVRFKLIYSYALADTVTTMNTITTLAGKIAQMEQDLAEFDVLLFQMMSNLNIDMKSIEMRQQRSDIMHSYLDSARKEKDNLIAEHMGNSNSGKEGSAARSLRVGLRLPSERIAMMKELQNHYK